MNFTHTLPHALSSSANWQILNEVQRKFLLNRIAYCAEIADAATAVLHTTDAFFGSIIDDLALDSLSSLGTIGHVETEVSIYQVHSTWIADCDPQALISAASPIIRKFLVAGQPDAGDSAAMHRQWVHDVGKYLGLTVAQFREAEHFESVVAALIVIDALLMRLLSYTALFRIGEKRVLIDL